MAPLHYAMQGTLPSLELVTWHKQAMQIIQGGSTSLNQATIPSAMDASRHLCHFTRVLPGLCDTCMLLNRKGLPVREG